MAKFDNTPSNNIVSNQQEETIFADLVDNLFLFEEAQMFYKKFVKFDAYEQNKTSISYPVWLDSFIFDSTDLRSQAIAYTKII